MVALTILKMVLKMVLKIVENGIENENISYQDEDNYIQNNFNESLDDRVNQENFSIYKI